MFPKELQGWDRGFQSRALFAFRFSAGSDRKRVPPIISKASLGPNNDSLEAYATLLSDVSSDIGRSFCRLFTTRTGDAMAYIA